MSTEHDRDFFLLAGIEWASIASAVRTTDPHSAGPLRDLALSLWREAGYCHLLLAARKYCALQARLRVLAGVIFPPVGRSRCYHATGRVADEATVLATAADLFERLRRAVSDYYPTVIADSCCTVSSAC